MCSIGGFLRFNHSGNIDLVVRKLVDIMVNAKDRGRDSWGIVGVTGSGDYVYIKRSGEIDREDYKDIYEVFRDRSPVSAIFNMRAEPTTEYVPVKDDNNIQPFIGSRYAVAHNGTIANDLEIEERFGIRKISRIDTSVLPPLLDKIWDGDIYRLREILANEIKGSYALAILDRVKPNCIYLATNFKPLYMMWDRDLETLFFSSYDEHLQSPELPPWSSNPVKRVEPYSIVEICSSGTYRTVDLSGNSSIKKRKRALVIISGGLDSTVTATYLLRKGYDVTLLHFNYRHLAESPESRAVREIAKELNVPLLEIETDVFRVIGKSSLLGEGEVNLNDMGREGAELPFEWVPARNFVFLAVATAIAEAYGYDYVALGINVEEGNAYPDNENEFYRLLNKALPYATSPGKIVKIINPVGHLVKHEIVRLGLEIGAPLHLTWSCYLGKDKHCGKCGPCYMRRWAFKMNGVRDPVAYDLPESYEKDFWSGCRKYEYRGARS